MRISAALPPLFPRHLSHYCAERAVKSFCWHGFQYVRISSAGKTGFAGGLHDIVGLEIHTNMSQTGHLEFDGSEAGRLLAGINSITLQSQRTNVAAYMPTDCPTVSSAASPPALFLVEHIGHWHIRHWPELRCYPLAFCHVTHGALKLPQREKHGWMGDALDASEQSMFNFDTAAVHTAFMQTIVDNQGPNGDVPTVVPNGVPRNGSCNDIAWTSVFPQLTNMMHSYHGDTRLIRNYWQALTKYQENLINVASSNQGLAQCDKYQDWLCGTRFHLFRGDMWQF